MTDELATIDDFNELMAGTQGKFASEAALADISKASSWLPYVQLMGSNSIEVKKGEFPIGHFALRAGKDSIIDLGDEVVMFLIAVRPKAMQFKPKVVSVFDSASALFKDFRTKADTVKNSGCAYGPEFFVWLPEMNQFASYFMGNKTGRNESGKLTALMEADQRACKQKAKLIVGTEFSWHGPVTLPYDLEFAMPPREQLMQELEKFSNPPEATEEPAEEDERG